MELSQQYADVAEKRAEGETFGALRRLDGEVVMLAETQEMHLQAIHPIIRPALSEPGGSRAPDTGMPTSGVILADAINAVADRVEALRRHLQDATNRVGI